MVISDDWIISDEGMVFAGDATVISDYATVVSDNRDVAVSDDWLVVI